MLVDSVMTRSVVTTEPSRSLHSAAGTMQAGRFRHLPVVQDGRLLGIVSDRDLNGHQSSTVADVMHSSVITVSPDTPVDVAARLMLENKIGALPVVDPGTDRLVGIVSQTDLFTVLVRLLRGDGPSTRLELELEDLPRQLADVAMAAHNRHISIASLVTLPADAPAGPHQVILRIRTMQARPFVSELRRAGIKVDQPDDSDG